MPSDKDLFKQLIIRFSLTNQSHLQLLTRMEQDCKERHISKNKLILECMQFYYEKRDEEEERFQTKEYIDRQIKEISESIRKSLYQELMQTVLSSVMQKDESSVVMQQDKIVQNDKLSNMEEEGEKNILEDPNIMENVMKWSG